MPYYRPQRSCGKVMFSQESVILFTGGGCIPACTGTDTSRQTPPGRHTPPPDGHCSGRYASYWNAFLLPPANVVCEGYVFTGICDSVNRGGMRGFIWGACVVLFGGHAWFYSGGMHGFIRGGGVHGFGGACMVLSGGVCGFIWGGMHGFIWGACVVLSGGVCGFIRGGMRGFIQEGVHGFIQGGVHGFIQGGHAWFFQFFRIQ